MNISLVNKVVTDYFTQTHETLKQTEIYTFYPQTAPAQGFWGDLKENVI